MQPGQAPTKPPLREMFTALGVEQLVMTFLDLQHNVFEAAERFGLTLAELEEVLAWPEAQELLTRAQRLSQLRTQPALDLIFPCAIDRLASVMFDEQAPAEARRKSAALLARICESRRRDRRPRPAKPNPETAPNVAPAPAPTTAPRETTTHDDLAEATLPAPLLRYIPADAAPPTSARDSNTPVGADTDDTNDTDTAPPRPRRTRPIKLAPLATFPLVPRPPFEPEPTTLAPSSDTS